MPREGLCGGAFVAPKQNLPVGAEPRKKHRTDQREAQRS